jgi:hypothetical protein
MTNIHEQASDSSVDIQYLLGRGLHRFMIQSAGNSVTANTSIDKQTVIQALIDARKYPDFLEKATIFVSQYQKNPSEPTLCRSPFVVIVRLGKEIQTARGCRSQDGGALSKLVRDGEFLLYSKN